MTLNSRSKRPHAKRIRELAGRLLDDHLRDSEWRELKAMLVSSDDGRRVYVETMLLHAHLYRWGHKRKEL
jgi:hypothetical protein